ncbi:peptidoglycan DD-metalloendopeptidase family protein [Candidatus Parcubacteria bacterium]|jgi:murein DD-endopeptidase MepM/ murein hydrolase activator NlpD|nr:peptidoglycan DD-metalloendopeptidase family protein [Candidatus Parcubacteria bacterium]
MWLRTKSGRGGRFLGWILLNIGKFTIFPFILFGYKTLLLSKIKIKNSNIKNINYLYFIKRYLPRIGVAIVLIAVTTNTIFAQGYNTDEYASRTLLSSLVTADEEQWSELIEEEGPAINQPKIVNYLEEQGNVQELVINNPNFEDDYIDNADFSTDSGSLVLLNPEDTGIGSGNTPAGRTGPIDYVVQPGDVIGKIAEKYNISVSTILWENELSWNSTIRPGQKLSILPTSGISHEIKSGDTVLAIAKKYQTEASEVVEINKLADAGDIAVGDLLFIPNGVKPTRVVSSYKPPAPVYSDKDVPPAANINTGTKFLWPLISKRITQYYHWGHSGLDVGDKTGKPIYAAEAGKVERSGWSRGYGYNVVINHGNGIKTLYAHSSQLLVNAGDSVSRGQTIALIGNTGWSTGPHLHFEVRVNEVRKNPLNYIK